MTNPNHVGYGSLVELLRAGELSDPPNSPYVEAQQPDGNAREVAAGADVVRRVVEMSEPEKPESEL